MTQNAGKEIFEVLKRALKAKGLTYADLAQRLDVSEPTIKRLFVECDCKFSRLVRICQVLGLTISEVTEVAGRSETALVVLPEWIEQSLADSPSLFWFYILLRDDIDPDTIADLYSLSKADIYLYRRELEELGLVVLKRDGQIQQISQQPIQILVGGPLHELYKKINVEFVSRSIDGSVPGDEKFISISRQMRPESAEMLAGDIQAFIARVSMVSRQDRLTSVASDLISFKWSIAADSASFATLMDIVPHRANKSTMASAAIN